MLASPKIPQLKSPLIEQLCELEKHLLDNCKNIQEWFDDQWQKTTPPVYGSVDLRNAGFKLAPIDMNLFPAGFNNLNPSFMSTTVAAAKEVIQQLQPEAKNILVIPESHTRNLFYWENVRILLNILEQAGFAARLGFLSPELKEPQEITLPSGAKVLIEPLRRDQDKLHLDGFIPDMVLLNNDLSDGIPEILQHVSQRIIPPAKLGWSYRLKSGHFQYYEQVANEFASVAGIDPWTIAPYFRYCGEINFMQQGGMECLIANAEILFRDIEMKYIEYQIPYQPFIVIKADAGTYGMAVMTVRNVDELRNMNRKQRTRMSTIKGGQPVTRVILQEGVYSFETIGDESAVAEPVVYLWGQHVVGGFYRIHKDRAVDESLNAPGMHFEPIAFANPCNSPCTDKEPDAAENRFFTYGVVARLSMLAAAREMKDLL
ncbi:MAG TPA: glutamate--cysteine ligase [Gammaproteobacteria bacterium]|nr:glutamate--cysteine ligase [Gammaproteobacteria bacterium]